ncbi:hypothetical protein [Nonomuraea recticatena]|uniref:hypothetical protein n=1 Tax=Nonomuraea recticatena TaxID=46178 RepID=UPI00361F20B2
MSEAPRHVTELAERRVKARAVRDYAAADALRQEIEQAGWQVRDSADGYELTVKPPSTSGRRCAPFRSRP